MGNILKHDWRCILLLCLLAACIGALAVPPLAAADSLTRGNMFTISIAGRPMTDYYIWFARTSSMTGEPGDQPPVIVDSQYAVEFDPDGGPYTIGSYQFHNGNGRTILDDVAPSSATTSNTRYYAKVTTDSDGYGIVQFSTSSATADKTFTIHAENPQAPGEEVPVALGLPVKTTTAVPTRTATAVPTAATTSRTTTLHTETTTAQTTVTTVAVTATTQETAAIPATTQKSPAGPVAAILAAGAGIVLLRRSA